MAIKLFPKYESKSQKLAPLSVYAKRLLSAVGVGCGVIGVVLFIGMSGYHWLAGFSWVDSFLEASMILGGMGPVNELKTDGAKIFAAIYALFSGLVFIGLMGIVLTPVVHRALHKFHVE
jgi:hypothetical protein